MAPIGGDIRSQIESLITNNEVFIFSKSTCPFCAKVKQLFNSLSVKYKFIELDQLENGQNIQQALTEKTGKRTVPQVFIKGQFIGGCDDTFAAHENGTLRNLLSTHSFDYDLVVVGGGSGGLAASKAAVAFGKKVAVLDFVVPTPRGTKWGLGGTCVNVGCIPKKLMHQSGLIGQILKDSAFYGWQTASGEDFVLNKTIKHDWSKMKDEINNYIRSLNFGYRAQLMEKSVKYINGYGSFVDSHTLKVVEKTNEYTITSDKFIIATGERPRYPEDCEGAKEYAITSDDIFSLGYCPGKTLVVGASYVALECAGFLRGIGLDVTVMVRSILLRGFDQEMAEKAGEYMKEEGIKFIRPCVPIKIEQLEAGEPGRLRVTSKMQNSEEIVIGEYNTVLFAIGRDACTGNIGLDKAGVERNEKNGKIPTVNEQTNVPHVYAIGDVLEGKPELTPVAIEAGTLLAKRLFGNSDIQCDYLNIPTTVFTPLEYGCVGYTEENAEKKFGADNLEVYIQHFSPLEWKIAHRNDNACFAKLICLRNKEETVVGFHYLGPNAGEVTQLAGLILKKKCTKADFDALIGIHPTCAEIFTTMTVTKRSGLDAKQTGC